MPIAECTPQNAGGQPELLHPADFPGLQAPLKAALQFLCHHHISQNGLVYPVRKTQISLPLFLPSGHAPPRGLHLIPWQYCWRSANASAPPDFSTPTQPAGRFAAISGVSRQEVCFPGDIAMLYAVGSRRQSGQSNSSCIIGPRILRSRQSAWIVRVSLFLNPSSVFAVTNVCLAAVGLIGA